MLQATSALRQRGSLLRLQLVVCFFQGPNDSVHGGIQYDWCVLLRLKNISFFFAFSPGEKITAMKLQGELGIFQQMPGQHQNNAVSRPDETLLNKLLKS